MEFQIGLTEITVITRISASSKLLQVLFSLACTVLWLIFCCASTFSSNSHYRSLYHGPTNASYNLTGVSCDSPGILKRFYALLLPTCKFTHCLVHAMPPQSPKIDHLPSDASAILRERYLAGTFSVVTQWYMALYVNVLFIMMTSSNGNIYRVTGPLCGEFTGPGESPHKGQWRGASMLSLICARISDWVNNREDGDLRRHRGHYDVIVMWNE